MRVEAAFSRVSVASSTTGSQSEDTSTLLTPMKIGNTQIQKTARSKPRLEDIRNNACFYCHKVGCRPWKHRQNSGSGNVPVANIESALASEEHNDSVDPDRSGN